MSTNIWAPKSVVEELQIQPPLSRVELHVHLDGSIRRETAFELLKVKNLKCPGDGSFLAFKKAIEVTKPKDLQRFLSAFPIFVSSTHRKIKNMCTKSHVHDYDF